MAARPLSLGRLAMVERMERMDDGLSASSMARWYRPRACLCCVHA